MNDNHDDSSIAPRKVRTLQELESEAGAHDLVQDNLAYACELARDGQLDTPVAFVYAVRNPKTGKPSPTGEALVLAASGESTEVLAPALRKLARESRAVAIAIVSEGWSIEPDFVANLPDAKREAHLQRWAGRLDEHPQRVRLAMVTVEHAALGGSRAWFARIPTDGTITVADFVDQGVIDGRLSSLLPSARMN